MLRHAILVSHGQPSDPEPPEAALAIVAQKVAALLPGWHIASATLAAPGRLESALETAIGVPVIYPFFMSRGWFFSRALPQRLGQHDHLLTAPFGLDANLPDLAARQIRSEISARGWTPAETDLLLAAHGSAKGEKAAEAANAFAENLRRCLTLNSLSTGFVEQPPFIAKAAAALGPRSLCLPFFAQTGDHVRRDIPDGLASANHRIEQIATLGTLPGVPDLIARALKDKVTRPAERS